MAIHASAGCDALSQFMVCLCLIDHADLRREDLVDGIKMKLCPVIGDHQGIDVSIIDLG